MFCVPDKRRALVGSNLFIFVCYRIPGVLEYERTWDERTRIQQENVRAQKEDIEHIE